jgi:hypothetical protein
MSNLDLEHGYCNTAGNRIHLYADYDRWAVVFEKCGYNNRGGSADIELNYVGNCTIDIISEHDGSRSNTNYIELISGEEYENVSCLADDEVDTFELLSAEAEDILVHGQKVKIERDISKYLALGIQPREYDNPKGLISYEDIVRYLHDTNASLVSASEEEIKRYVPFDLPKLMKIDHFHFESVYNEVSPSNQETYQLIAKVLATGDKSEWKPTLESNNHWRNWESGHL